MVVGANATYNSIYDFWNPGKKYQGKSIGKKNHSISIEIVKRGLLVLIERFSVTFWASKP